MKLGIKGICSEVFSYIILKDVKSELANDTVCSFVSGIQKIKTLNDVLTEHVLSELNVKTGMYSAYVPFWLLFWKLSVHFDVLKTVKTSWDKDFVMICSNTNS